jgi:hypothetical protein
MPGDGKFAACLMWFYCGAFTLCLVVAAVITLQGLDEGQERLIRGVGMIAIFAGLALAFGLAARNLAHRRRWACYAVIVLLVLFTAAALYGTVYYFMDGIDDDVLERLGGALFAIVAHTAAITTVTRPDMKRWCDR